VTANLKVPTLLTSPQTKLWRSTFWGKSVPTDPAPYDAIASYTKAHD
jgi:hypothetical protein